MTNPNSAAQAANENPLSDEYVNAIIQRHGYDSPECVIARLHQWIGLHGGENGLTLLMYEAHKTLSKLRAPVSDIREGFELTYAANADDPACASDLSHFTNGWRACIASQVRAPVADERETVHNAAIKAAAKVCADIARQYDPQNNQENALASELYSAGAAILKLVKEDRAALASAPVADERAALLALRTIAEYPTPGEGNMSAANMREIARAALSGRSISGKCPPPPSAPPSLPNREVESGVIKPHAALASAPADERAPEQAAPGLQYHILKTDPEVFQAVLSGEKTFEIRLNDRGYAVGDVLGLCETKHTGAQMRAGAPLVYTGRECQRFVSHVLTGYGLADGWCCLSFRLPHAGGASAPIADERAAISGVTLDGCLETLFCVGEHLGINYAESRKQPGAPSGVYIKAIEDRVSRASNAAREEAAKLMEQTSRSSGAALIRTLASAPVAEQGNVHGLMWNTKFDPQERQQAWAARQSHLAQGGATVAAKEEVDKILRDRMAPISEALGLDVMLASAGNGVIRIFTFEGGPLIYTIRADGTAIQRVSWNQPDAPDTLTVDQVKIIPQAAPETQPEPQPARAAVAGEVVTDEMIQAGAKAAREYFERTGGNDPAVIYRAMRAAAPAAPQASAETPKLPRGWQLALNLAIDAIENAAPMDWPVNWPAILHGLKELRAALSQPQADKDAAPCTCPSGDGSLRHPCAAHPAKASGNGGEKWSDS